MCSKRTSILKSRSAARSPSFFICAANVRTGKMKIFHTPEVTPDVVLASACLPQIFQAVEINGEHYWDGGDMGNPVLDSLFCSNPGMTKGRQLQ